MNIFQRVTKYTALFEPEINFLVDSVKNAPEGEVVIAGSYKGGDAMSMIIQDPMRNYHVIDSFQGLADPVEEDIVKETDNPEVTTMKAGEFSCGGEDAYINNFKEARLMHPDTYPMFITEESIKVVPADHVAVLWLDLDHYAPTKVCLDYFKDRLVKGAIIGCHDYGFIRCPGVKPACDEFSDKWKHAAGGIFSMRK